MILALLEEAFESHGVHQVISQLTEALKEAEDEATDSPAIDYLDGLKQAVSYIERRLSLASPVLTSAGRLNQLKKAAQATLNELNQYNSNSNPGHLTNASNQVDAALNNARLLISIGEPDGGVKASDAVSFKRLAEKVISELRTKTEEVIESSDKVADSLQVSEHRLTELNDELESLDKKISVKLEEVDTKFSEKESEREKVFEEDQDSFKGSFEELENSLNEDAKKLISDISEKKDEAERIVQLVGNIGLTGNYRGIAERERNAANLMRWIALGCFASMFVVIGLTLFYSVKNGFDPWLTGYRFIAGLVLIIPATYAAKESSRHSEVDPVSWTT